MPAPLWERRAYEKAVRWCNHYNSEGRAPKLAPPATPYEPWRCS